ncbi:hypothetical protein [Deinococcus sp. UYEF24]
MIRVDLRAGIGPLRLQLAGLHLGIAVVAFIRPNLIELIPSYRLFAQIGTTGEWGMAALLIGGGLLLLPRASPLLILWQAASSMLFSLFAILVTGNSGLTWGTVVYGGLAVGSAIVAYITADGWFAQTRIPQRFRAWLGGRLKRGHRG